MPLPGREGVAASVEIRAPYSSIRISLAIVFFAALVLLGNQHRYKSGYQVVLFRRFGRIVPDPSITGWLNKYKGGRNGESSAKERKLSAYRFRVRIHPDQATKPQQDVRFC